MTAGTITAPDVTLPDIPRVPPRSRPWMQVLAALPLAGILVIQALLTIRLLPYVGSDYADEAIYIYGGHQLLHQLLHGGGSPYYETWYSGAPVIYPVQAAIVDHFGGLVLAREMSLCFMLVATTLLFFTARRLFGYWVGVIAAALFAGLGMSQNLGALATYDAMSLMLLAFAAYCAVRSADSTRWLLLIPAVVLAANATKYVTVLFDPIVVGLGAFQLLPLGWRRVWQRILALGVATSILTAVIMLLAGSSYFKGIMFTTLSRKAGANIALGATQASPGRIVSLSWYWMGAVAVLGVLALLIMLLRATKDRTHGPLLILLIIAGVLVTLGNIRLHTAQSMEKHDDFGAWFACIPAAYALSYLADAARRWYAKVPILATAVLVAGVSCYYYSQPVNISTYSSFTSNPVYFATIPAYNESMYAFLGPYLKIGSGEYLLGSKNASEMIYSNHSRIFWWQFFDDTYVKYPIPGRGGDAHGQARGLACGGVGQPSAADPQCMYLEGAAGYVAAIRAHWFVLVTLDDDHKISYDADILAAIRSTPGYVQISDQGGAPTFIYAPDYPTWEKAHPAATAMVRRALQKRG